MSRLWRVVAAAAVLATGLVAAPATADATAAPIGDCTTTHGVILAVDFGHWGGPVLRACGTAAGSGYDLINEGGWHTAGTAHDGPGFVCRIGYSGYDGGAMFPTAAQDRCLQTPPASAYWSYWLAQPGQHTWTYSAKGAVSDRPRDGEVEAWVFGATDIGGSTGQPSFSPDSVRAHNTAPVGGAPTNPPPRKAPPPATHRATEGTQPAPAVGTTRASHAPVTHPTTATTPTPSPTTTSRSSVATGGTTPTTPAVEDAQPKADVTTSAGSPWPFIIGGVIVLALAAGGGVTAWRRRSRS